MSTPFTLDGALNLPGTPGLAAEPLPFSLSSQYDSKAEFEFNLPASAGSQSVNFGTMPSEGTKAIVLIYDTKTAAPPVQIVINGSATPVELSTGGFLVLGSPDPVAGITSLSITYTGAGRIRVWLLG